MRDMDPTLLWTLLGVLVGTLVGIGLNVVNASSTFVSLTGFPGRCWLNTLKLLVLPLLSLSIVQGVSSLGENKRAAGRVCRLTLGYYFLTTTTAVLIGIVVVNLLRPGQHSGSGEEGCHGHGAANIANNSQHDQDALESILRILEQAFPGNIVDAAARMNVLGVVTFSVFFGAVMSQTASEDEGTRRVAALLDALLKLVTRMVEHVLSLTPVGVLSLIAASIADACDVGAMAQAIALYIVTVVLGLGIQAFVVLPCLFSATTRSTPMALLRAYAPSFVTAFGTDSSSATLPVTLRCAKRQGVQDSVANFVLPLGATVNMNGTALYEALTVIFIAQRHGVTLTMAQTFVVVVTGTMAAVGAAAIPSAGLVTMLMVLQAVGLSQFASDIALVVTVDWFLDRLRTVVNVEGDAVGVAIVDHLLKEDGEDLQQHRDEDRRVDSL